MVSETKIDDTFPESQFLIFNIFKTFKLDRTAKGGGILLYIREDIPCRYIKQITLNNSFDWLFVELLLRSKNWLLRCSYNNYTENIASHLTPTSNKLCTNYENMILLDDFKE